MALGYSQLNVNDAVQLASNEDQRAGQRITSTSSKLIGNQLNKITVKLENRYRVVGYELHDLQHGVNQLAVTYIMSTHVRTSGPVVAIVLVNVLIRMFCIDLLFLEHRLTVAQVTADCFVIVLGPVKALLLVGVF